MNTEPSRQIHLDFHTSEHLPDVGAAFSKSQFQDALRIGRVNLINVFAKGHHGWSYYPTKIGNSHPHLKTDLLGGQIEACHEIGVKAPVYFTVGWSANDAEAHPEWCVRTAEGDIAADYWDDSATSGTPKPAYQWKHLCPSGEYHELMMSQSEEICRMYAVDGFWYDIYLANVPCYCERCRRGMSEGKFDVTDLDDVYRYRAFVIQRHCEELLPLILGLHPEASIYFNGLTSLDYPQNQKYRLYRFNTKNDLEDLPTTWGGYDKFPLRAKWFLKEKKPIVAMSGKFHTSWGEFGGFKDPEALRYEAASIIAFGASCNFGDQLHPCGVMDMSTYANVGHAYEYVEKIEHLGIGGIPVASLGFLPGNELQADEGAVRMLLEEQIDFDVVGTNDDLSAYESIVVPSVPGVLEGAGTKIKGYLANGGTLLILGRGLLNAAETAPAVDLGVAYDGPAKYDIDYTVVSNSVSAGLPASPFLNYSCAVKYAARDGEILAHRREPYFRRTYGAYCGHLNAPYRLEDAPYSAAIRKGGLIVCAHDLDRMYYDLGAKVHRSLFANLLGLIHTGPMAQADLPSSGRISMLRFPDSGSYVLHLLYAPPLQRGRCLLIEDLPELRDVAVRINLPVEAEDFRLEPAGIPLDARRMSGGDSDVFCYEVTVPQFSCHCAIVVSTA